MYYLIGSHEYALLHTNDEYYQFLFDNYGGPATVRSYGSFENIFKVHGDFYRNLKFYYLTDKYLFVHAGINPDYPLEEQDEVDLVYIRGKFIYSKHKLPQKIIFGIQSLMNHILMKAKFVLIWDAESIRMHIYVH